MKARPDPVIATARLVLRQPGAADVDDIVAGVGDPAVARMLARVPHPYRRDHAEDFIARSQASGRAGRTLVLAIVRGRLIGIVSIEDMPGRCELGYWLARHAWGKGYATEAATAILAYGFDRLGLRLVRSAFFVGNRASGRVQQKLGFAIVGRHERASLARGAVVAHIATVLTRPRFQALHR